MNNEKWLDLQLFAGEGTGDGGGEGAATGAESVDAGHKRLLELGVPADKIRKNRSYGVSAPAKSPATAEQAVEQTQNPEQDDAAEDPTEEKKTDAPSRMSWEEIIADPEYNKQMQATIQARLRSAKGAEEALGKLAPALQLSAQRYGLDAENIDYAALAKAICDDDANHEDEALKNGDTVEETKRKFQERTLEQQKFRDHIVKLEQQGEAMKQVFPKFDLRTELQNPVFARMTSPNVGLSVEDAYYAVHRKELQTAAMQVTAQTVAKKISNDIQSGSRRPNENGTSGQAPSVTTFDYRSASREQREALKNRIRSGERIVPGQE